MHDLDERSAQQDGVTYELRSLTNRWLEPMGSSVLSTHSTAKAALDVQNRLPREAPDGGGRSTCGSFVPTVVVRIAADGTESVSVPRPIPVLSIDGSGGGRW